MVLSPEERRKIYEEEKARIEANERLERDRGNIPAESSTNLAPRVAGLLCYLGVWISGIVFIVIEQKNRWVRFHAAQSIVVFGILWIAGMVLGWIPFIGGFFSFVLGITGVILWIVLMVKASNGERYKVPWAGDIAEMIIGPGEIPDYHNPPTAAASAPPSAPPPVPPQVTNIPQPPPPSTPYAAPPPRAIEHDDRMNRKIDDWFSHRREGRITGSAFAIAWCIILLVFFNFFNQYVAYYTGDSADGIVSWTKAGFFTSDIGRWLPMLNTALVVAIICHLVMILVDKDLLRQGLHLIMDGFGLATVITLLIVYPFDFNVIPNEAAADGTYLGVTIVLIVIAVGIGIGLLVKLIKLLVSIGKAVTRVS